MEDAPDDQPRRSPSHRALTAIAIVVVSILLLFALYVFSGFGRLDGNQTQGRAQAEMRGLVNALNIYFLENGHVYPENLEPIRVMNNGRLPQNPYTNADYIYNRTQEGFELRCFGRDGAPGGTGSDENIIVIHTPDGYELRRLGRDGALGGTGDDEDVIVLDERYGSGPDHEPTAVAVEPTNGHSR